MSALHTHPGWLAVARTARAELEVALADRKSPPPAVLGTLPATPAGRDAFEVHLHEGTLHLRGSTPRGLLQAVFALREALAAGERLAEGLHRQGAFGFAERIFHARFSPWPGERADARWLAHLGATHCLVAHDWQGSRRSLQGYVTSPVFPDAVGAPEVAANHAGLRQLIDACTDYGLGAMLWLTELPCQGGPWVPAAERDKFLARFPAEVLSDSGTYEGQVLCFSHPRVQDFYRDLLGRFFADFPEIETIFLFGLDSGGEFCDPESCPRCRGLSRMAQRDRLVNFLIEAGGKVRPGLRVLTTGWKWDRDGGEFLQHQAGLPAASGVYLAAQKDGWQCERQAHGFMHAVRKICRERGQTFIGYDNFHWGDDTVHGLCDIQDFPLGIGAKLKRWHALEADGIFDHWGNAPEDIWCNSIACREFFLNPAADVTEVGRRIAHRQFGAEAGEFALAAWTALEQAHAGLSAACTWAPGQWPGWYEGRKQWPLPGGFSADSLRAHQSPPRTEGDRIYNPVDFADALQAVSDAWRAAFPHYQEAVHQLSLAAAAADDGPLFYRYWWNGPQPTPNRREHLQRQLLHVESMALAGHEIGLHFGLHARWERTTHDPEAYRAHAAELLRHAAAAARAAAAHFQILGKPKDWARLYTDKAAAIEQWLAAGTHAS